MAGGFDPDAYLSNAQKGFDPDAYLKNTTIAEPHQSPAMEWKDVPGQAFKNAPESALEFGKNLIQPIIHPIDTAVGLKNLGMGVLEKVGSKIGISNQGEHEKYADAVGQYFKDKYGGEENIKNALANDPVGVLADVSSVMTGAGAAVRGTAKAAELANLSKTADVLKATGKSVQTAGAYTDPVNLAGKAISTPFRLTPEARMLEQAGVTMTPGQMMIGPKGTFKKLEDAASSVPILGSFINSGREKTIHSYNQAVAKQVLEPIGETLSKKTEAGHALVKDVEGKIGAKYDQLLPHIQFMPDQAFHNDFQRILRNKITTLPTPQAQQFNAIINQHISPRGIWLSPIDGPMLKKIESELTYYAKNYGRSPDPAQRQLGQSIGSVLTAIRTNLERVNPSHAGELANINRSWAMYARLRDAAQRRATSNGVFMPSDLLYAIKNGDKTVGHGAFARGDALMQTFGEAGQKVLPSKMPTSGTPERLMSAGLLGAGVSGVPWLSEPTVLTGLAASSVPYTGPGLAALKGARTVVRNTPWREVGNVTYRAGQNQRNNPYAP